MDGYVLKIFSSKLKKRPKIGRFRGKIFFEKLTWNVRLSALRSSHS